MLSTEDNTDVQIQMPQDKHSQTILTQEKSQMPQIKYTDSILHWWHRRFACRYLCQGWGCFGGQGALAPPRGHELERWRAGGEQGESREKRWLFVLLSAFVMEWFNWWEGAANNLGMIYWLCAAVFVCVCVWLSELPYQTVMDGVSMLSMMTV